MSDFHRWSWWLAMATVGCVATPAPEGSGPLEDNQRREQSASEDLGLSFVVGLPCGSNADCGRRFYCKYSDVPCGGLGICEAKPRACEPSEEPVCGCDDRNYANACVAANAGTSVQGMGGCAPAGEETAL
jgi:hypothetical protein